MKNEKLFIGALLFVGVSIMLSAVAAEDVATISEIPHIDEVDLHPSTTGHRSVSYTKRTMYAAGTFGMIGLGGFALYFLAEKRNAGISFMFRNPEDVRNTIMKED